MRYFCGLDLGQATDYTALVIVERILSEDEPTAYHVRHINRFKLGTPYPEIVERVDELLQTPALDQEAVLVVDGTGVGAAVVDLFPNGEESPYPVYPVHIHGGDRVTREGKDYRVPKRDLVSVVQVLLQNGQLKIAEGLPETKLLIKELLNFKVKIDPQTAHDSYAAWREADHDDLVLATALACWVAGNVDVDGPPAVAPDISFCGPSKWDMG
jgi:hypothetical protein